jgi:two-component system sensor histidine kinase/response regulator
VQEREKCLSIGMNDYVTKPINPEDLYEVLRKWMHPRTAQSPEIGAREPANAPENRGADLPGHLPGISQEDGLGFVMGRTDLYRNVLARFLELKAHSAEGLRAALARGDLEGAGRLAHSMISGAATIGARELSATSRALEDAILAGDPTAWQPLAARFETNLTEVLDGLAGHFGAR